MSALYPPPSSCTWATLNISLHDADVLSIGRGGLDYCRGTGNHCSSIGIGFPEAGSRWRNSWKTQFAYGFCALSTVMDTDAESIQHGGLGASDVLTAPASVSPQRRSASESSAIKG
jgi:hypothetical protein